MDITYLGPSIDFIDQGFYDSVNNELGLDVIVNTPTQVVAVNVDTGWQVTFDGIGLNAVTLAGTVTGLTIRDNFNAIIATFTNFSWPTADLVAALTALLEADDEAPLNALLDLQEVNFNGALAVDGIDVAFNGLMGNVDIVGTPYSDTLEGGDGHDGIEGGAGFDTIIGNVGNDTIDGGNGNDLLIGGPGNDSILGSAGFDAIFGGPGNDRMIGGFGNDGMYGGLGFDTIEGGPGNDVMNGEAGFDLMAGGGGHDTMDGGAGNDQMLGGPGNDSMLGGLGFDTMNGNDGNDWMKGEIGNDLMAGNAGHDTVDGGVGNDYLAGGDGYDLLAGGTGDDTINGGSGNDAVIGGAGLDVLIGGTGNDRLIGRAHGDTFVFSDGHGDDIIVDFEALNDNEKIDLSAVSAITGLADLDLADPNAGAATQAGADVVIDTGGGNSITLLGVNLADLDANDFIF